MKKKIILRVCLQGDKDSKKIGPYLQAEWKALRLRRQFLTALAQDGPVEKTAGQAAVWLTDKAAEAQALQKDGSCVIYVLTRANQKESCPVSWCAELEGWNEQQIFREEKKAAQEDSQRKLAQSDAVPGLSEDFLWQVWLRHYDLPWHILETKRLCLREMTEADLDFLYGLEQDPEAARFLEKTDPDRRAAMEKIAAYRRHMYGFYGFGIWLILEKDSGCPVGRAGLQVRDGFSEPELGFAITAGARRQGYAYEACEAILAYARTELETEKLIAVVDAENVKSRRLCGKLGFAVDKTAKAPAGMCIYSYAAGKSCKTAEWRKV